MKKKLLLKSLLAFFVASQSQAAFLIKVNCEGSVDSNKSQKITVSGNILTAGGVGPSTISKASGQLSIKVTQGKKSVFSLSDSFGGLLESKQLTVSLADEETPALFSYDTSTKKAKLQLVDAKGATSENEVENYDSEILNCK